MPAVSWGSRQEPRPSETLSLGTPGQGGWRGDGGGNRKFSNNGRLGRDIAGAGYSTRSGAFFVREAAVPEQVSAGMENGHVAAGPPQPPAGQGAASIRNEAPEIIPFLNACFAELRAKGLHEPKVFQHTASLTDIRQLWHDICRDGLHKLKEQECQHLIAGLVIWHLKRQPEPLIPYSLYGLVVAAGARAAAAAAARRLQHEERDDDEDDEEDDLDDDEEADRGGGRGLGGEGGAGEVGAAGVGVGAKGVQQGMGAGGVGGLNGGVGMGMGRPGEEDAAAKALGTGAQGTGSGKVGVRGMEGVQGEVSVGGASAEGEVAAGAASARKGEDPKQRSLWERTGTSDPEWGGAARGTSEAGAGAEVRIGAPETALGGANEGERDGASSEGGASGEWDAGDGTVALRHLQNLAAQLPYNAWQVLCLLLEFLAQVAALSKVNEMTSEALAQTFAPVLCRPQGSAFMSLRHVQDLLKIQAVIRVLIENHNILSQNRNVSNHSSTGNKALLAGQARGGGKDGLGLTLSPGGRRASTSDLHLVQQLINDSVSLLVYSGSEGDGEDDGDDDSAGDGSGDRRSGGRRRGRSGAFGNRQAGRLSSFLRPHMLHAMPAPLYAGGDGGGLGATGTGPAYLRKHSFFDLDDEEDDEEFHSTKKEALSGMGGREGHHRSSKSTGTSSTSVGISSGPSSAGPGGGAGAGASNATNLYLPSSSPFSAGAGSSGPGTLSGSSPATHAGSAQQQHHHRNSSSSSSSSSGGSNSHGGQHVTSTSKNVGGPGSSTSASASVLGDDAARAAGDAPGVTGGSNVKHGGKKEAVGGGGVEPWNGGGAGATPLLRGGRRTVAGALERRRMMQACRTLRAQINHYEAAFQAEYGHPPIGREQRSPLVSTYAQYKSWKQFIRDDASTQLQSFYRGYRERERHPEVPRLLRKHRPSPPPPPSSQHHNLGATSTTGVIPSAVSGGKTQSSGSQAFAVGSGSGASGGAVGGAPMQAGAPVLMVIGGGKGGISSASSDSSIHSSVRSGLGVGHGTLGSPTLGVPASPLSSQRDGGAGAGGGGGAGASVSGTGGSSVRARASGTGSSGSPTLGTAREGQAGQGEWDSKSPGNGSMGGRSVGGVAIGDGHGGIGSTASPGMGGGGVGGGPGLGAVATDGSGSGSTSDEEAKAVLTRRLTELLDDKRRIKVQLKDFDMNFFERSGRLPTKAEKEPMRHLYDRYNGLKHQIRDVESLLMTHRQQHSPQLTYTPPQSPYTASPRGVWDSGGVAIGGNNSGNNSNNNNGNNNNNGSSTTSSNSSGSSAGGEATTPPQRWSGSSAGGEANTSPQRWTKPSSGHGNNGASGTGGSRGVSVIGSPSSVAGAVAASTAAAAAAAAAAVSAAVAAGVVVDPGRVIGSGSSAERLEQLKKEKRVLHVMLKNFEKEFKEKNGREVNCPEDIAPVEGEYQKYKMIKKRLAQLSKSSG